MKEWVKQKLEEYKRLADAKWHRTETTHYISVISDNANGQLKILLVPEANPDISESWYWFFIGIVAPKANKQEFEYMVKYTNEVYVHVNGWDELVSTLESDLKEYNQKMIRALQKNLERDIDSLPG